MRKVIDTLPDALIEKLARAGTQALTYYLNASTGDRVKTAASPLFPRSRLLQLMPPDDYFGIHHIVMGSEEMYGPNRNADGFPAETLKSSHPTFVTHGAVYDRHNHKPGDPKLGLIKAADYCPKTQRVELFLWVSKKAAPQYYEEAQNGHLHNFSMSAAMPYDVCSCCLKKTAANQQYCEHIRNQLMQWLPEYGRYAFTSNPIARFFDASFVPVPADRTARALEVFTGTKKAAAQDNPLIWSGRDLASIDEPAIPDYDDVAVKTVSACVGPWLHELQKLAAAEHRLHEQWLTGQDRNVRHVLPFAFDPSPVLEGSDIAGPISRVKMASISRELLRRRSFISPFDFIQLVTQEPLTPEVRKEACAHLPFLFRDLLEAVRDEDETLPCECVDALPPCSQLQADMDNEAGRDIVQRLMDRMSERMGYSDEARGNRITIIVVKKAWAERNLTRDKTQVSEPVKTVMRLYGLHKLAHLSAAMKERAAGAGGYSASPDFHTVMVASHYPFFMS